MHRTPLEQYALAQATFGPRALGERLTRYALADDRRTLIVPRRYSGRADELRTVIGRRVIATPLPASKTGRDKATARHRDEVRHWLNVALDSPLYLDAVPASGVAAAPTRSIARAWAAAERDHRRVETARALTLLTPRGKGGTIPALCYRDAQQRVTSHARDEAAAFAAKRATASAQRSAAFRGRQANPEDNASAAMAALRAAAQRAAGHDANLSMTDRVRTPRLAAAGLDGAAL
jgi:hypothetical protein